MGQAASCNSSGLFAGVSWDNPGCEASPPGLVESQPFDRPDGGVRGNMPYIEYKPKVPSRLHRMASAVVPWLASAPETQRIRIIADPCPDQTCHIAPGVRTFRYKFCDARYPGISARHVVPRTLETTGFAAAVAAFVSARAAQNRTIYRSLIRHFIVDQAALVHGGNLVSVALFAGSQQRFVPRVITQTNHLYQTANRQIVATQVDGSYIGTYGVLEGAYEALCLPTQITAWPCPTYGVTPIDPQAQGNALSLLSGTPCYHAACATPARRSAHIRRLAARDCARLVSLRPPLEPLRIRTADGEVVVQGGVFDDLDIIRISDGHELDLALLAYTPLAVGGIRATHVELFDPLRNGDPSWYEQADIAEEAELQSNDAIPPCLDHIEPAVYAGRVASFLHNAPSPAQFWLPIEVLEQCNFDFFMSRILPPPLLHKRLHEAMASEIASSFLPFGVEIHDNARRALRHYTFEVADEHRPVTESWALRREVRRANGQWAADYNALPRGKRLVMRRKPQPLALPKQRTPPTLSWTYDALAHTYTPDEPPVGGEGKPEVLLNSVYRRLQSEIEDGLRYLLDTESSTDTESSAAC